MKGHSRVTAWQYIEELLGMGRYTFTRKEATRRLKTSPAAVYMALHRLERAGKVVMLRAGFYVIVDPQHRSTGMMPPEWFIQELMKDLDRPYYVGLLSAAQIHGAAHQAPQEFQVVIPKRSLRPVRSGNVKIRFFGKGLFDRSATIEVKTPVGFMKVSTPETTAWDIIRYPRGAGGFDHAVTVLAELAEKIDSAKLMDIVIRHDEVIVIQRLGYIFERLGRRRLAQALAKRVQHAPIRALDSSMPLKGASVSRKWGLWVNAKVEAEA